MALASGCGDGDVGQRPSGASGSAMSAGNAGRESNAGRAGSGNDSGGAAGDCGECEPIACPAPSGVPTALRTNGRAGAFDLEGAPRFGWQVPSERQTAYELRVASTRAAAEQARGDVWTSGKVSSAQQSAVEYAGDELTPGQRYYWTVRSWDADDEPSCWSQVASFGMGLGASWSHSVPIWAAPSQAGWRDATLRARLTIDQVALGLRFRAPDNDGGYMWQLRGAANQLVPHVLIDGKYSALKTVALPAGTLALGKEVEVSIAAVGSVIETSIDGVLVDTTSDERFSTGGVGVRTGATEAGKLLELSVTSPLGAALLSTSFPATDRTFECGTLAAGALEVDNATSCLNRGLSADWAFLRKDVALAETPIASATLYAAAADASRAKQYVYKAYVNGHFVGLGPTQAIGDEARYDGFDVTDQLVAGSNVIGVLGYTRASQQFQAELWVRYEDGTEDVIGTDESWGALSGLDALPAAGSIGTPVYEAPRENVDARHFPYGWEQADFDASAFLAAREKPAFSALAAAPMSKVTEQRHAPMRIVEKSAGHYFIDFGRTWIGGVHYEVAAGKLGSRIELRFGEVPSATDTVRYQMGTGNDYHDVLTLKDGAQSFNTWGMRVFRYLEVIGAPEPITAENLQALALVYPFDEAAATFESSNPELDRVWELAKNTIETVNVNFYTDSWTRERTNYEGDAYLQLLSTLYLSDDAALGHYSIDYFQKHRTWPTEWPLYVILAVHDAWQRTGDASQLRASYRSLQEKLPEAWLSPDRGLFGKATCSNGSSSATDCDLVDWPQTARDGYAFRHYNTVVNALVYRAYRDMADIAAALGNTTDAARYSERADALREAMNQRLYDPSRARYDDGMDASGTLTGHYSLHASAFALAFGVPSEAEAPRVAASVAARGMACSVYAAAFLTSGLFAAGQSQAALDLLTSADTNGWLNMLRLGAGATAEAWDPSQKRNMSYSHPWAASPAFTLPLGLFGIRPLEPGYARVGIEPKPGKLDFASITVPTVRGTVAVAFAHGPSGDLQLGVRVPGNALADLSMPVPRGATTMYVNGAPRGAVSEKSGYALLSDLGLGCHLVTVEPETALGPTLRSFCANP